MVVAKMEWESTGFWSLCIVYCVVLRIEKWAR